MLLIVAGLLISGDLTELSAGMVAIEGKITSTHVISIDKQQ